MHDGVGLGSKHPEGLVAYLPAVAVGAVQEIPAPALADSRDLGQLVAEAGCDQDPPRPQHLSASETNKEAARDLEHLLVDQLDAVPGDLLPPCGEKVGWGHSVAGQVPVHVGCGGVAWRSGIDDGDSAPCPTQHESRAESGRAAANYYTS